MTMQIVAPQSVCLWPISAATVVRLRVRYRVQSSRAFGRAARQLMTQLGHQPP
jgi:hypothetical protein